jgi:hypothetical protein
MTALLGAIDTVIAEAKAARKRAVNDPEEFNVTSIIDNAVAMLEQVKTRLQQNISAGGDDFCKQPAGYIE